MIWGVHKNSPMIKSMFVNNHVFMYGSLKRGYHNNHWLGDGLYLQDALTSDAAYEMHPVLGFFPLIVPGNYQISGELYVVSNEVLLVLDHLEGNGMSYTRKQIKLSGVDVLAWMYIFNYPDELPPDGDLGELVETKHNYIQTWLKPEDYFDFPED